MICATVTGYLAGEPKLAFTNATGEVYRIRVGSTHNKYNSSTKTWDKDTLWSSGLVSQKKLGIMKKHYVKGTPVVIVTSDLSVNHYQLNTGEHKFDLELGYVDKIEAYQRIPRSDGQTYKAAAEQAQQAAPTNYGQVPPQDEMPQANLPY